MTRQASQTERGERRSRLTVDVEGDGGFATLARVGLVDGDAAEGLEVIRLAERVGQSRDGHPRFDPGYIRRVGLVAVAVRQVLVAQEPANVGGGIPAPAEASHRNLHTRRQGQITPVRHGTQVHLQLGRAGRH